MMPPLLTCLIVLCGLTLAVYGFGSHTIEIHGSLTCPSDPSKVAGVKVYVFDKKALRFDTKMAHAVTDEAGHYRMNGKDHRWVFSNDPHLHIYHRCKNGMHICPVHLDYELMYAAESGKPINAGVMNLEINPRSRRHACL